MGEVDLNLPLEMPSEIILIDLIDPRNHVYFNNKLLQDLSATSLLPVVFFLGGI